MAYLSFLIVLILAFAGFLALTLQEEKRGRRYFANARQDLDDRVAHIEFIVTHVDFAAFVRDTARETAERIAHDVAHLVLQAVRWTERQLTRAVRTLRERRAEIMSSNGTPSIAADGTPSAPAQASDFARAISDFKQELRAQREDAENAPLEDVPVETTGAVE